MERWKKVTIIIVIVVSITLFFIFNFRNLRAFFSDEYGYETSRTEINEITKRAISQNDINLCNQLPQRDTLALDQIYPKDTCIQSVALESGNFSLCNHLTYFEKNSCITEIAVKMKDSKICDIFSQSNDKDRCLQRVSIKVEDCLKISHKIRKSSCISNLAFTQKDVSLCEYIEDSINEPINNKSIKEACIESILNS